MTIEITAVQKIQEVPALLTIPNSRIVAGGTTFDQNTSEELRQVDISGLEGLDGIKQKGSRIELGALAKLQTMADSALLKTCAPALAQAAANAGTADVRERGTLGGNLCAARIGDTAVALLASGAKLTIKTDSDFRELLIDRFWDQNGKNDLQYDEWITRVTLQIPKEERWGAAYGKIGEWDLETDPIAAAAVQLGIDEKNTITSIRGGLRLGTNGIRRMFALEKALKNRPASDENLEKAVKAMAPAVQNRMDEAEFVDLLMDIVQRSLIMAQERRML